MNKKHLIIMGAFGVAFGVVTYLGWALLIKPVQKKISARAAERDDVDKKLKEAKTKATQYDKFRAQAENIRRDLGLISLRLDPDFSLREKNRVTAKALTFSNLYITKVTTEKRDKSKLAGFAVLDEIPFTLAVSGGFHELGEYMNNAIAGQRMLVPGTMDLKQELSDSAGMNAPTLSGTLKMSLFLEPVTTK